MRDLNAVLDELIIDAPVEGLSWSDVQRRSRGVEKARSPKRRRMALSLAAATALTIAASAVAVGVSLRDQQQLYHDRAADHPERIGPLVEVVSGGTWALVAWQSKSGICVDFAVEGNSPFACGLPVRGAKPAGDASGSGLPVHAIAGQVSGAGLVGGDGKTTVFGVAATEVAAVKIELHNGQTLDAAVYDAASELDTAVRFFIVRVRLPVEPPQTERTYGPGGQPLQDVSPVRALVAYDPNGDIIERVQYGR
jgi:hypothetical protein